MRVLTVCSTIRGISDDGGRESTFAKPEGLHGNLERLKTVGQLN